MLRFADVSLLWLTPPFAPRSKMLRDEAMACDQVQVSALRRLRHVDARSRKYSDWQTLLTMDCLRGLRSLSIECDSYHEPEVTSLALLSELTYLDLCCSDNSALLEVLPTLSCLRSLVLGISGGGEWSDEAAKTISRCSSLQSLSVRCLRSGQLPVLIAGLRQLEELTLIDLEGADDPDDQDEPVGPSRFVGCFLGFNWLPRFRDITLLNCSRIREFIRGITAEMDPASSSLQSIVIQPSNFPRPSMPSREDVSALIARFPRLTLSWELWSLVRAQGTDAGLYAARTRGVDSHLAYSRQHERMLVDARSQCQSLCVVDPNRVRMIDVQPTRSRGEEAKAQEERWRVEQLLSLNKARRSD